MRKINVNGREITTNFGCQGWNGYPYSNGEDKATMTMCLRKWVLSEGDKYVHQESEEEMFNRLVSKGYTRITFYETTTNVKGLHDLIAFCK